MGDREARPDAGGREYVLAIGKLYGWGAGHTGILGGGPAEDTAEAVAVAGLPLVVSVTAGPSAAYAIDSNGGCFSWGWDSFYHLLGRGRVAYEVAWLPSALRRMGHRLAKHRMEGDGGVGRPELVSGLPPIQQVAATGENVYALSGDGHVWSWGRESGVGFQALKPAAVPQRIETLSGVAKLAASPGGGSCYALDASGCVYSWGRGWDGELGHGRPRVQTEPKPVPGLTDVEDLGASKEGGWARTGGGELYYWGNGQEFGLQRANSWQITEPLLIDLPNEAVSLATGPGGCLLRLQDGSVWGMGIAVREMLGDDVAEVGLFAVPALERMVRFSLGNYHAFCWNAEGEVFSFGRSEEGALGHGKLEDESWTPRRLGELRHVTTAWAGNCFSLAVVAGP